MEEQQQRRTAWERQLLIRDKNRPTVRDYIPRIFTDFYEMHGDRNFGDDGAIIGGIGFAIYIALSALEWRGLALFAALAFGLEAGYAFLSALDCREKDKDSVSYNIVWGTGALAILMLLPAVMTIIKG